MKYLVDTYNLVHAGIAMGGALGDLTVGKLCRWIAASPRRLKVTLILDGRAKPDEPSANEFPEIEILYSGTGVPADRLIGQLVERSGNRKQLTVVTNDRAVVLHARSHFAQATSCEAFLQLLLDRPVKSDHKAPPKSTPGETAHWLKEFGLSTPPQPPPPPKASQNDEDDLNIEDLLGPRQS